MREQIIAGQTRGEWRENPIIKQVMDLEETFWINPTYKSSYSNETVQPSKVKEAEERLQRFAPYISKVFPETISTKGIIESPLVEIPTMKRKLEESYHVTIPGSLMLKCDHHLPISGSIKARGGIYEVLKRAEDIAMKERGLKFSDNYEILSREEYKELFSKYSIAVGSTGNLGLSIGIISAQLGFNVTVHMSADAKQWKKDKLTSIGAIVKEYEDDYSKAVEEGRKQASIDPTCHFIDDENSVDLLIGYATAASRLKKQLEEKSLKVDKHHPLFVYVPCGVGGGPGGITYGLKLAFQENVHCFFAEPTHSPCMTLGLATGLHDKVSVQDFGVDNKTEADGLAVGRPSKLVSDTMTSLLSGSYTIDDARLFELLRDLAQTEHYYLEPSALAGAYGPIQMFRSEEGQTYIRERGLRDKLNQATHIVWATGGGMVPKDMMDTYLSKA